MRDEREACVLAPTSPCCKQAPRSQIEYKTQGLGQTVLGAGPPPVQAVQVSNTHS